MTHNHVLVISKSYDDPLCIEQLKTVLLFGPVLPCVSVLYCWQLSTCVSRRAALCHACKGVT